jgi:hypothetical protein
LSGNEVQQTFFQFAGVPYTRKEAIVTRSELLSEMNGYPVGPEKAPSSREFVEEWIKNPALMVPLIESYEKICERLLV